MSKLFISVFSQLIISSALVYADPTLSLKDYSSFSAKAKEVEGQARFSTMFGMTPPKMVPVKGVGFGTYDRVYVNDFDNDTTVVGFLSIEGEGNSPANCKYSFFETIVPIPRDSFPLEEGYFLEEGDHKLQSLTQAKSAKKKNPSYLKIFYEKGVLVVHEIQYVNWDIWCGFLTEDLQLMKENTITIKADPTLLNIEEISFVFTESKTKKDPGSKGAWVFKEPEVVAVGVGRDFMIKKKKG